MDSDLTPATIDKLVDLGKKVSAKENRILEIGGKPFDANTLQRIYDNPRPGTLAVSSLSAIADYIKGGLEKVNPEALFAHIVSPERVRLCEAFSGDEKKRTVYMEAALENDADPFKFWTWYETEAFIIALMSLFEATEDRDLVLQIASSLVSESKIAKTDNGATSKLQVNAGVVNTSDAVDPGVAILRPFRTFRQVEQPASSFLFRYRAQGDMVVLTLIEADGGAWKHEAMARIAEFFGKEVPNLKVIA
jgi:hypothetical protein